MFFSENRHRKGILGLGVGNAILSKMTFSSLKTLKSLKGLVSFMPSTPKEQPNNPLHGITLKEIVIALEGCYGWDGLASRIPINCFLNDPSVASTLKFLRKTPWARSKVEDLYLAFVKGEN